MQGKALLKFQTLTFYLRVKAFTSWILQLMGKEDREEVCWDNKFEDKMIEHFVI